MSATAKLASIISVGTLRAAAFALSERRRVRSARVGPARTHIAEAVRWICRAHDVAGSAGVSRSYNLIKRPSGRQPGWMDPYPETTGYIIPTFFRCAAYLNEEELRERAIRMAEWEIEKQLDSGAVQEGLAGHSRRPAVFNTGQVMLGWVAAHKETGRQEFLDAAEKAGRFLVENQDAEGPWRGQLSTITVSIPYKTYNTRVAWALALLGSVTGNREFGESARKNLNFSLKAQHSNGWLENNCLTDPSRPLTHTIAYSLRGFLESGPLLNESRFTDAAAVAAKALADRLRHDGSLAGRYDSEWSPAVSWSCLTGNAQMAIVWFKLARLQNNQQFLHAARQAVHFLKQCQHLTHSDPGVRGAIPGSFPLYGGYYGFEYTNWTVKFFVDALLEEESSGDNMSSRQTA